MDLTSGNQTWLAGKIPIDGSFTGKIIDELVIFHCHV